MAAGSWPPLIHSRYPAIETIYKKDTPGRKVPDNDIMTSSKNVQFLLRGMSYLPTHHYFGSQRMYLKLGVQYVGLSHCYD